MRTVPGAKNFKRTVRKSPNTGDTAGPGQGQLQVSGIPAYLNPVSPLPHQAMEFDLTGEHERYAYKLLAGLVTPRPIAWVTTQDEDGRVNAAPVFVL